MLNRSERALSNLEDARSLRVAGCSYREIRRKLFLSAGQISLIRRTLKRAKSAHTRLRRAKPNATYRDLPVRHSTLPTGLRTLLTGSGYVTLGDLADRLTDPDHPGLEALHGIGPHRARLVRAVLDHHGLLPGPDDIQALIEQVFPEFRDASSPFTQI